MEYYGNAHEFTRDIPADDKLHRFGYSKDGQVFSYYIDATLVDTENLNRMLGDRNVRGDRNFDKFLVGRLTG